MPIMMESDEAKKKEIATKMVNEKIKVFLEMAEKRLKDNGGQYFVGGKVLLISVCAV